MKIDKIKYKSYEVYIRFIDGKDKKIIPMGSQYFYESRYDMMRNGTSMRPLTVTGLIKGVIDNFWNMNISRIIKLLLRTGFMDLPPEGETVWQWKCFKRLV